MVSISDASEKLRRFKRDLVADLFLQRGTLWGYVQRVRTELGISSAVQIPEPVETRAYYPRSWEQLGGKTEQQLLRGAWLNLTHGLRNELVPEIFRLPHSPVDWTAFISACLLYDPPETQLLVFARLGDDWLTSADADERVLDHATEPSSDAPVLPIKMLPDPFRVKEDAHWYRDAIIDHIGKEFLEPLGLDIWEMYETVIRRIRDDGTEQWMLGHKYVDRQLANEAQPYIFVTEETTENDIKKAFRSIKASQQRRGQGGRPTRDRLVAIQCAVLYDRYRSMDSTDKRRRNWTYESLAKEFDLDSADAAEDYVNLGRKLMDEKDTP